MDYSRFNYVAQPEDGIPVADLIPKIGEYDKWAIHWGYAPIATAKTSDDEQAQLNKWASEQDSKPQYRFSTANAGSQRSRRQHGSRRRYRCREGDRAGLEESANALPACC